jgi:uncharacterized protein with LGFP repeats
MIYKVKEMENSEKEQVWEEKHLGGRVSPSGLDKQAVY